MKKLLAALMAVVMVAGVAFNAVSATGEVETTTEETTTYELTEVDYLIIDKFAEKIDEIAAEKGEAFKVGIVTLIRTLAEHEKATDRVTAVFLKLADVVENGEEETTNETGSVVDTGTVNTGSLVDTGATAETWTVYTGDVETGATE